MNMSATATRVLVAIGVAAGALAVVTVTQNSAEAAAPTPDAVFRFAGINVDLLAPGGPANTIVGTMLPAGDWVLQAKANAVYFGQPEDFIRCGIFVNSRPVGVGSTTHLGAHKGGGGTNVGLLTNVGVLRTSVKADVRLMCSHDLTVPAGSPVPYIEDGALLATRPGVIDG